MPQRMPYSAQAKFGTSGTVSTPCGAVSSLRGMAASKRQFSMLTTICTISGLPPGGARRGRSVDIWNGMRGLVVIRPAPSWRRRRR